MSRDPHRFLVQAVLFDLDGTLVDSTRAVDRSWARWERRWGVELGVRASALGRPARDIVADLLPPEAVEEAFLDIEAMEVADVEGVRALPGAHELLAAVPTDRWAVATSCSRPLAVARLAAAGIAPAVLVTSSDTARGKPSPDPYLEAARRLGLSAHDCLVVEDAVAGVAAGRAAGCATLGVLGTVPPDELAADVVVAGLPAIAVTPVSGGLRIDVDAVRRGESAQREPDR